MNFLVKNVTALFAAASVLLVSIISSGTHRGAANGISSDKNTCEHSQAHSNSNSDAGGIRAYVGGCDTMVQINTSAQLQTLLNNGYCTVTFVGRYLENANVNNPKKSPRQN